MQPTNEIEEEMLSRAKRMQEYADIRDQLTEEQREMVGFVLSNNMSV